MIFYGDFKIFLVDKCKPNHCKNGGTCTNGHCECKSGCSGKTCENCVGKLNTFV